MKKTLTAVALAAMAFAANAQLSFSGGTLVNPVNNYNPNGPAAGLMSPAGQEDAIISSSIGGMLTATFLGFEALDTDTFTFSMGSGSLSNQGPLGASISGPISAGNLNFTFQDMTVAGNMVGNGGNGLSFASYSVLGSVMGGVFTPYTLGGAYQLILGFNDGLRVDADYDDLVVGLNVAAIPEPETYALMLAGLGAIGFIGRRRQKKL